MSHGYKDLIVWQKAVDLATFVYELTEPFPKHELYGLTSQMRRAAVSVASNIAEGQGRLTKGEFVQFLGHSRGSLFELETQLLIAVRLKYCSPQNQDRADERITEVRRMLVALVESVRPKTKGAAA